MEKIDPSKINRIVLGLMQKHSWKQEKAEDFLTTISLLLKGGENLKGSVALQAAFITSINCGKRCFLGGVLIDIPENIPCLLPNFKSNSFNEIAQSLGAKRFEKNSSYNFTLCFGMPAINEDSLEIVCNGWQAGVVVAGDKVTLNNTPDFATGGVAAGSYGTGLAFLKISLVDITAADSTKGISLWNPEINWLDEEATGPAIINLPDKYWMLGLGHLGQAYLWNISLLPYNRSDKIFFILQDTDTIEEANMGSGMLAESNNIGNKKTDVCAEWLHEKGFTTQVKEVLFDSTTKVSSTEPKIALCGFDNPQSRIFIEDAGFEFIVESGLGNDVLDFDKILLHTFPNEKFSARDIWLTSIGNVPELNTAILEAYKNHDDQCGIEIIAGKAVATSFVGAFSGSLVISELLKKINNGNSLKVYGCQLRRIEQGISKILCTT